MLPARPMRNLIAAGFLTLASGAAALEGEPLTTMPHGPYECAVPGDAAGEALVRNERASFTISNASSYRNADGSGVYLMKGDRLVFTRGPLKGERMLRDGPNALRKLERDGSESDLLCVRRGSAH